MSDPHYAVIRAQKYRLGAPLDLVGNHNERIHSPRHADPLRADQNVILVASGTDTFSDRVRKHLQDNGIEKVRSNAIYAIEYLMQPGRTDWQGDVTKWAQDSLEWVRQRHGEQHVFSAVLHQDEKTPHLHVFTVPIHNGKLHASHWLDGPTKLSAMQNSYAKAMEHHGLARGEIGGRRKHIAASELRANSTAINDIVQSAIETIPSKGLVESSESHRKKMTAHLNHNLAPVIDAAKSGFMTKAAQDLANDADRRASREKQARLVAEDDAKKLRREQADRVRELPVADVLAKILEAPTRSEGSSIIIETDAFKYVATGQKFAEFKAGKKGGGGAIDAAMSALSCDYNEALRWLVTIYPAGELESTMRAKAEKAIPKALQIAISKPVLFTEKLAKFGARSEDKWPLAERYLTHERGISADIVTPLREAGNIWANAQGSVVFAHRSNADDQIVGATIRGINDAARRAAGLEPWKQAIGSKAEGFFRLGDSGSYVAICESPIDALALAQLHKDHVKLPPGPGIFASTGGEGGDVAILRFAKNRGLEVFAAQDAEDSGDKQADQTLTAAKNLGLKCQRLRPKFGKDWADFLKFLKNQLQRLHASLSEDGPNSQLQQSTTKQTKV